MGIAFFCTGAKAALAFWLSLEPSDSSFRASFPRFLLGPRCSIQSPRAAPGIPKLSQMRPSRKLLEPHMSDSGWVVMVRCRVLLQYTVPSSLGEPPWRLVQGSLRRAPRLHHRTCARQYPYGHDGTGRPTSLSSCRDQDPLSPRWVMAGLGRYGT